MVARHEAWRDLRVPQSGWMHEPRPGQAVPDGRHGPIRNTFKRTHRWARVLRHEDELAQTEVEEKVSHVLVSSGPEDLGLYGKPMARNAQLWTHEYRRLLDGPHADPQELERAVHAVL